MTQHREDRSLERLTAPRWNSPDAIEPSVKLRKDTDGGQDGGDGPDWTADDRFLLELLQNLADLLLDHWRSVLGDRLQDLFLRILPQFGELEKQSHPGCQQQQHREQR